VPVDHARVSSSGHQLSPVIFDDLHFLFRPYDPWLVYGQSKIAKRTVRRGSDPALGGRRDRR
jgi:hypothetical protein